MIMSYQKYRIRLDVVTYQQDFSAEVVYKENRQKMIPHNCDNDICKLLNPCNDELLSYQEVMDRVIKSENSFYDLLENMRNSKKLNLSAPFGFLDWSGIHMVYQLPNKEFIYELAKKIKELDPKIIIEVGAGRGIISRHISKILNKKIILTDSYDWWEYKNTEKEFLCQDVLKRNYIDAIEEFKPDLIIVSWIPYSECWTKDFRKYPFVKGYILIGENRGGATGCDEDWNQDWQFQHIEDAEKYGVCKTDHIFSRKHSTCFIKHTSIVYFERP